MIVAALILVVAGYVPQREVAPSLSPELEERVQKLASALRCAVCQGVSIADSPASMAQAQLETVRALVQEGKTDEEIQDYFVARYGQWVLLEPPREGFNWVVWLAPLVALVLGAWAVARTLRASPPAPPAASPPAAPPTADPADPYLAQVRRELDR